MLHLAASCATSCFAWRLVPTKITSPPWPASLSRKFEARMRPRTVSRKARMLAERRHVVNASRKPCTPPRKRYDARRHGRSERASGGPQAVTEREPAAEPVGQERGAAVGHVGRCPRVGPPIREALSGGIP